LLPLSCIAVSFSEKNGDGQQRLSYRFLDLDLI
jgi:hypothetical protein